MKHPSILAAAALAAALATTPACASQGAGASADLAAFGYTLYDLNPSDGIAPAVTWASSPGYWDQVTAYTSAPGALDSNADVGNGSYAPLSIQAMLPGLGSAYSSVSGAFAAGGLELHASASTYVPTSVSSASAQFGGDPAQNFLLSPGTVMVFTGQVTLGASSDLPGTSEMAWVSLGVASIGANPEQKDGWTSAINGDNYVTRTASVSFSNVTGGWLEGRLWGSANAFVQPSSPVPEPGNAVLLLAGLGLLGVARRRAGRAPRA
jgi:hypothetical protein